MEQWKKIENTEYYWISSIGRMYSTYREGGFKEPWTDNHGYKIADLYVKGKRTRMKVHRLVAMYFIPNPNNLDTVDHIDSNRQNNNVENLQWLTKAQNTRKGAIRKVFQYTKDGEFVKEWSSLAEAGRFFGGTGDYICRCANGRCKSAYGYLWKKEKI